MDHQIKKRIYIVSGKQSAVACPHIQWISIERTSFKGLYAIASPGASLKTPKELMTCQEPKEGAIEHAEVLEASEQMPMEAGTSGVKGWVG